MRPVRLYVFGVTPTSSDTWFSSGLWPIGTLGWPEDTDALKRYFPTSTLITGQDILFFWVARMMMMQLAVVDEVPFTEVYLHGLVRDAKGKKMSKSVGNVVDPLDIIDEFGADALRFSSAAMASLGGVLKLDMERVKGYRNFGNKIWQSHILAEMNGVFEVDTTTRPAPTHPVNKWIMGELGRTREAVDAALADYRFNDAAQALYAFFWGMVCDKYNEFTKPMFGDASVRLETQQTMGWVLDQSLILLHPIMPFITEELWAERNRDTMLIHAEWPSYGAELVDAAADEEIHWVINLIESIRSVRAQMNVPAGDFVPLVQVAADDAARHAWANNAPLIQKLARVSELTEADAAPKGSAPITAKGATIVLPLAGLIDVDAEKARLEKKLGKLAKELGGLQGRLKNPKFVASAPAEVIEETKELAAEKEDEKAKLDAALRRLAEMA